MCMLFLLFLFLCMSLVKEYCHPQPIDCTVYTTALYTDLTVMVYYNSRVYLYSNNATENTSCYCTGHSA